jgi:hypothetical protein
MSNKNSLKRSLSLTNKDPDSKLIFKEFNQVEQEVSSLVPFEEGIEIESDGSSEELLLPLPIQDDDSWFLKKHLNMFWMDCPASPNLVPITPFFVDDDGFDFQLDRKYSRDFAEVRYGVLKA